MLGAIRRNSNLHGTDSFFEIAIPTILDGIVGTSRQTLGNLAPSIAHCRLSLNNRSVFLGSPWSLFDGWIQLVEVTFPTLLGVSSLDLRSNLGPFLFSVDTHKMQNSLVLVLSPLSLDKIWIQHFGPSMKALYIGATREAKSNRLPVFGRVLFHLLNENRVLLLGPFIDGRGSGFVVRGSIQNVTRRMH